MKVHRPVTVWGRRLGVGLAAAIVAPMILVSFAGTAQAAKSDGCEGGGFSLFTLSSTNQLGATAAIKAGATEVERTIPAAQLGTNFRVQGRYAQFDVRSSDFAVLNQAFTGAKSTEDITGGRFTPVFASKVPLNMLLNSAITVSLDEEELQLGRTGTGVSMKIQAKDCAQGGIFQMEPQRSNGSATTIVHTLAAPGGKLTPFYFDNPRFREKIGQFLGADCTSVTLGPAGRFCVQVSARVNIANDLSPKFVARDSTQVAIRTAQTGTSATYSVQSGGRMGFVTGEDAVEVANPPTDCTHQCQAQNQVRGRLAVLGFPFTVPTGSRL